MKLSVLAVGRTERGFIEMGVDTYLQRIRRFYSCELDDFKVSGGKGMTDPERVMAVEGDCILSRLRERDCVVLLNERGSEFTSVQFADWLGRTLAETRERLVFVIGGAYGVSPAVEARANQVISFSRMTFSHQLVRIVLFEQLYRACTILHGFPYHNP